MFTSEKQAADYVNPFLAQAGTAILIWASLPFPDDTTQPRHPPRRLGWLFSLSLQRFGDLWVQPYTPERYRAVRITGTFLSWPVNGQAVLDNYGFSSKFRKASEKAMPVIMKLNLMARGQSVSYNTIEDRQCTGMNLMDPGNAAWYWTSSTRPGLDSRLKSTLLTKLRD